MKQLLTINCSFFVTLFLACFFFSCEREYVPELESLTIGVMLPYSGDHVSQWDNVLDWAVENINEAGGVSGYELKLEKHDIGNGDVLSISKELAEDDDVCAVIGPLVSADVMQVAPIFVANRKIMVAPFATSSEISRAFSNRKEIWRLVEPDISQVKTLLLLAQQKGAQRVGLVTDDSSYGASFEDWFGFFATELGIEVSGIEVNIAEDVSSVVDSWTAIEATQPDQVIVALSTMDALTGFVETYDNSNKSVGLLFSDMAALTSFVTNLGQKAESHEGITIASDPGSGFDLSYYARYGEYPDAFLSNVYDAVLAIALGLEACDDEYRYALPEAMQKVFTGKTGYSTWRKADVKEALGLISTGVFPDINGASGSLDYNNGYFTDVASSTYGHWKIQNGKYRFLDYYTSDGEGRVSSTSAAYNTIAQVKQQFELIDHWPEYKEYSNNKAFLMATSEGWINYRHQSDVLHCYKLLREKGFSDDDIILVLANDIVTNVSNNEPGVVRNELDGVNLYTNVEIDYLLDDVDSTVLKNILCGHVSPSSPIVLDADENTNVFMFTSGHGAPEGLVLEGNDTYVHLSPKFWQHLFNEMNENKNYRQLFWSLEACYSGGVGEEINTPGVMLMTGANAIETSKSIFFDTNLKAWLADKFALSINTAITDIPQISFNKLYEYSFSFVNGSHVSFYNYENFGSIYDQKLSEFIIKE